MPGVKNGHKTSPETAEAKMRAAKALELRMEGKTFATIAKEAGYNSPQAARPAKKRMELLTAHQRARNVSLNIRNKASA